MWREGREANSGLSSHENDDYELIKTLHGHSSAAVTALEGQVLSICAV